jgi:hypothetical protein
VQTRQGNFDASLGDEVYSDDEEDTQLEDSETTALTGVVGKCRLSYRFLTLRPQPHPPAPSMALHPLLTTICFLTLWKRQSSYLTI